MGLPVAWDQGGQAELMPGPEDGGGEPKANEVGVFQSWGTARSGSRPFRNRPSEEQSMVGLAQGCV